MSTLAFKIQVTKSRRKFVFILAIRGTCWTFQSAGWRKSPYLPTIPQHRGFDKSPGASKSKKSQNEHKYKTENENVSWLCQGTFKDRTQMPDLSKSTSPTSESLNMSHQLRQWQTVMDLVTVRQELTWFKIGKIPKLQNKRLWAALLYVGLGFI